MTTLSWSKMMKHTTEWREIDNGTRRIRAEYGFHTIGDQEPYMSVTGTTHRRQRRRWREDSGGCIHDEIAEHFPELAPLIKWHLCSQEKGPMHYVANAQYWASIAAGLLAPSKYGPDPAAAFESTVVFGAVEGDELPWSDWPEHDNDATDRERRAELDARVKAWCEARFDALMAAFHAAWADRVPDDQLGA